MANDRLYLFCGCGKYRMLYKYLPAPETGKMGHLGDKDSIEKFINDHMIDCFGKENDPPTFSLIWENKAAEITHMHVKKEDCDLCSGQS